MHKQDRHCRVQRFAKALKAAQADASGWRDGLQKTLIGWCAVSVVIALSIDTIGLDALCIIIFTVHSTVLILMTPNHSGLSVTSLIIQCVKMTFSIINFDVMMYKLY